MKKKLASLIAFFYLATFSAILNAQDDVRLAGSVFNGDIAALGANIIPYIQLDIMAAQGEFKTAAGTDAMRAYAVGIDPYYSRALYDRHKKDILVPVLLNVLTGGGGSLLQGDWISGLVLQCAMAVSYGSVLLATMDTIPREAGFIIGETFGCIGFAAGITLPILYGKVQNKKLRYALALD